MWDEDGLRRSSLPMSWPGEEGGPAAIGGTRPGFAIHSRKLRGWERETKPQHQEPHEPHMIEKSNREILTGSNLGCHIFQ